MILETEQDHSIMRFWPNYKPSNRENARKLFHEMQKLNQKIVDLEILFMYEILHGYGDYRELYLIFKERFNQIVKFDKNQTITINNHYWEMRYAPH